MDPRRPRRIAIVGGGIAGLATAHHLGVQDADIEVTLLEREPHLCTQSSGLNAAILRTMIADPLLREIGMRSAEKLRNPPEGFAALVDPVGLLLVAAEEGAELAASVKDGGRDGIPFRAVPPGDVAEIAPYFGGSSSAAFLLPDQGRIDIAALSAGFERRALASGVRIRTGAEVAEILRRGSRAVGVRLADGTDIEADITVIAAGGFAGRLALQAGSRVSFTPRRRHLMVTAPDATIDPCWPIVWTDGNPFYARPESGGLMLCACDEAVVEPDRCTIDDSVRVAIARKTALFLPRFAEARAAHFWAGLRTFAEDGRFVIGFDPEIDDLFFVAGLGGHGMVSCFEVGRLAADGLTGKRLPEFLTPDRLVPPSR